MEGCSHLNTEFFRSRSLCSLLDTGTSNCRQRSYKSLFHRFRPGQGSPSHIHQCLWIIKEINTDIVNMCLQWKELSVCEGQLRFRLHGLTRPQPSWAHDLLWWPVKRATVKFSSGFFWFNPRNSPSLVAYTFVSFKCSAAGNLLNWSVFPSKVFL